MKQRCIFVSFSPLVFFPFSPIISFPSIGGRSTYTGHIPMGQLFAIPSSVDLTTLGLNTEGMVIGLALQRYGLYFTDHSTDKVGFFTDAGVSTSWVTKATANLPTLVMKLRPVTNNGPSSVGGGGTPLMPL